MRTGGFRRVDSAKIALARSYGASTLQIFWKIRAPMALPMILVGLMIGAIFGLLTAVGAEMVGGGFGLGNRLTTYSSMIQMPQFFGVVLILSFLGIGIPPEIPTWGNIMAEGRTLFRVFPHNILFPGLFLALTVFGVNMLGDGLRDVLDPKMERRL